MNPHRCRARRVLLVLLCAIAWLQPGRLVAEAPIQMLRPGEYVWTPHLAPDGPLLMVVSLDRQLAFVYRNGVRIGVSTISSGRPGYETPSGVFSVLQKRREHYSNLYDAAPMPFMQRLTWDGIALHAGNIPGYPASHGCIRLPEAFAERLFSETGIGMTVVIGSAEEAPQTSEGPHLEAAAVADGHTWQPDVSPEGPVSVVVDLSAGRAHVLRNGVEIGTAPVAADGPVPSGTRAFMVLPGEGEAPSRIRPDRPQRRWLALGLPEGEAEAAPRDYAAIRVDPVFGAAVYDLLQPGTVVVLTDQPMTPHGDQDVVSILQASGSTP